MTKMQSQFSDFSNLIDYQCEHGTAMFELYSRSVFLTNIWQLSLSSRLMHLRFQVGRHCQMSQLLLWLLIFATVNRASHAGKRVLIRISISIQTAQHKTEKLPKLLHISVVSYNLPHFCDEPAWNSTATTFADEYLVGTKPTGMFIDNHDTIYMANQRDRLIHVWKNDMNRVILNLTDFKIKPISLVISQTGNIFVANGEEHTIRQILNITNDFRMIEVGHLCEKLFIDRHNALYCSSRNGKVLHSEATFNSVFLNDGLQSTTFFPTASPKRPYGLLADSSSTFYICDCDGNVIKTFIFRTIFGYPTCTLLFINLYVYLINNWIIVSQILLIVTFTFQSSQQIHGCKVSGIGFSVAPTS